MLQDLVKCGPILFYVFYVLYSIVCMFYSMYVFYSILCMYSIVCIAMYSVRFGRTNFYLLCPRHIDHSNQGRCWIDPVNMNDVLSRKISFKPRRLHYQQKLKCRHWWSGPLCDRSYEGVMWQFYWVPADVVIVLVSYFVVLVLLKKVAWLLQLFVVGSIAYLYIVVTPQTVASVDMWAVLYPGW